MAALFFPFRFFPWFVIHEILQARRMAGLLLMAMSSGGISLVVYCRTVHSFFYASFWGIAGKIFRSGVVWRCGE
jgi:hypothetical protein